jgi:putative ABC transport system permease protein
MKLLLDLYLKTKSGYLLRAVGDNDTLVTSLAKDKGTVKIIGLAIANAFVALAGSVYAQKSGFFEISTGTGTIVIGLASVIIGINLFTKLPFIRKGKRFKKDHYFKATTAVIFGSIVYKLCVAIAISAGMAASDLKLITAVLFLIILVISNDRKRRVKSND